MCAVAALLASGVFVAPDDARARDAFVEINQTCATLSGCFPGDAAGFPVTIDGSAGRQYRLASDLTLADANTHAIVVGAFGVDLDLGGFAILGPVSCTGAPAVCAPGGGTGIGVSAANPALESIAVHDGAISGMGDAAIRLGGATTVRHVRVRSNGDDGVVVGEGSRVLDVLSRANGGDGIVASDSAIGGSSATGNGGDGIRIDSGTITDCRASQNGGVGISVATALVSGSTAQLNSQDGITSSGAALIRANLSASNGLDGIDAGSGASVVANTVRANSGFGLRMGAASSFRENAISSPSASTLSNAGGVDLGANSCNGATTCP